MKHKLFTVILAFVLLLTFSACVSRSTTRSISNTTRTLRQTSKTETLTLDVSAVADSVSLEMFFDVDGGTVQWMLTDPDGEVRWEGTAARTVKESRRFDTIAGEWLLDVTAASASGKYSVRWEANGNQMGRKR